MALTQSKLDMELRIRNLAIYTYYLEHPEVAVSDIAKDYCISTQRVRFLISRQFRNDKLREKSIVDSVVIKEICP